MSYRLNCANSDSTTTSDPLLPIEGLTIVKVFHSLNTNGLKLVKASYRVNPLGVKVRLGPPFVFSKNYTINLSLRYKFVSMLKSPWLMVKDQLMYFTLSV